MISAASWEISAFSPLRICSIASNSFKRPHLACMKWHSSLVIWICIVMKHYCFINPWTKIAMLTMVFTCRLWQVPWKKKNKQNFLFSWLMHHVQANLKKKTRIYWIGLTNHLGDSGMKNRPSRCTKQGMIAEKWKCHHIQANFMEWCFYCINIYTRLTY